MLKMPEYPSVVNLIPYGLPQFLDFEAPPEKLKKIQRYFIEKEAKAADDPNKTIYQLEELQRDPEEGYLLEPGSNKEYEGEYYPIQAEKHLEPFLGKWLPVPFLRQSGDTYEDGSPRFRPGPTNWARAYITRVPSQEDPEIMNWRVVLAFDMQVEERQGEKHVALSPDDVTARATCSLAADKRDNSWFLTEGWVDGWLQSLWDAHYSVKENQRSRPRKENSEYYHLDYLAAYFVYLQVLKEAIENRSVRILNLAGAQDKAAEANSSDAVDVDLILDIGNSRSTGILVENVLGRTTDLNDSYLLALRDLSQPENLYIEPFETRVEFSKADFGPQAFSKRSGRRSNAFSWASPIRTGNEATRLANMSSNAGGSSGMTSPKRYLWDQEDAANLWFFNRQNPTDREELVSSNPICRFVNNTGTLVSCVRELEKKPDNPDAAPARKSYLAKLFNATLPGVAQQDAFPANQPRFSRSSMMMFLLMELIQQALVTINSPAVRYARQFHDRPRRLRSIIFTVPPGMPFAEQRIYRRWAYAAVQLLWDALGWKKTFFSDPPETGGEQLTRKSRDFRLNPEIRSRWDEATCTQLVYLYNEINRNYQGDAHLFFEIMGKKREVPKEGAPKKTEVKPTLRIATIDMGGGTTDLSITTYVLANDKSSTNRIWPKQENRDGANFGGDDVLRKITMEIFLKAINDKLEAMGVSAAKAGEALREMFGKKSDTVSEQNQRIQFLRLIAMPISYEILEKYEKLKRSDLTSEINISVSKLVAQYEASYPATSKLLKESGEFFDSQIENRCGVKLDILDLDLSIPSEEVDKAIGSSARTVLNNMGEVINAYDCDVLLLTGRPSCWNAITRQVFAMLPVAPDRVIPMRDYQVGPWYPFASSQGKITDPKTTVVTGAILCTLAENSIEGFVFDSSKLELKSTARFIGQMDTQGTLPREMVWFPNERPGKEEDKYTKIVDFSSPITIGFRQLEVPRWSATRCWRMEFASEEAQRKAQGHTPYKVKVKFVMPEADEGLDNVPEVNRDIRAQLDEPIIDYRNEPDSVLARQQAGDSEDLVTVPGQPVRIMLRTLAKQDEEGHWMDTGVLY